MSVIASIRRILARFRPQRRYPDCVKLTDEERRLLAQRNIRIREMKLRKELASVA